VSPAGRDHRTGRRRAEATAIPVRRDDGAMVNPIPEGYPRVSPSLSIDGAAAAIEFYKEVFDATERMRMAAGDKVAHAELQIGDSVVMLADEYPEMGFVGPHKVGGTPVYLSVFVEDVDATFAKALELGATELRPVQDQFYGDRSGNFEDPWGHRWSVATHVEDVSEEEMGRRMSEMTES
jgi:PhnB protein